MSITRSTEPEPKFNQAASLNTPALRDPSVAISESPPIDSIDKDMPQVALSQTAALENKDILKTIFHKLSVEDVCRAANVCKVWCDVASDPDFWRDIDVSKRAMSASKLCWLLRRHTRVVNLNARGVDLSSDNLVQVLPPLTQLKTLELQKASFWPLDLEAISNNLPELELLVLAGGKFEMPVGGGGGFFIGGNAGAAAAHAPPQNAPNAAPPAAPPAAVPPPAPPAPQHAAFDLHMLAAQALAAAPAAAGDGAPANPHAPFNAQFDDIFGHGEGEDDDEFFGNMPGAGGGANGLLPQLHQAMHAGQQQQQQQLQLDQHQALQNHHQQQQHHPHHQHQPPAQPWANQAAAWANHVGAAGGGNIDVRVPRLSHPTLESLTLVEGEARGLYLRCPRLRSLEIDRLSFTGLRLEAYDAIERVKVTGGTRAAEQEIATLLRVNSDGVMRPLPALREIVIHSSVDPLDDIMTWCGNNQPALEVLELCACKALTGRGLANANGWRALKRLTLLDCDVLSANMLGNAVEKMTALEKLTIRGCGSLNTLRLQSRRLLEVELSGPRYLSTLEVDCPNLSALVFKPPVTGLSPAPILDDLRVHSSAMRELRLQGLPQLHGLRLRCPNLEHLEIAECEELRGEAISALDSHNAAPCLRSLAIIDCHALDRIAIAPRAMTDLKVVACGRLHTVQVEGTVLESLELTECNFLRSLSLSAAATMTTLSLGSCPSLEAVTVRAANLEDLSIRGCNQLASMELRCPRLRAVDAELCSSLTDAALGMLAKCSELQELQVGACTAVSAAGMAALASLRHLRRLDLAYTSLEDPAPLAPACASLTSLVLTDNFAMDPEALLAMLRTLPSCPAHLDVSYCRVPPSAAAHLATNPASGASLAINGMDGAPGDLWPLLHGAALPCPLRSLSFVKTRGLAAFYLGLMPAEEAISRELPLRSSTSTSGNNLVAPASNFVEVATPLVNLAELRLGVGDFSSVGVALPHLECLELSGCGQLVDVELRCPSLTHLKMEACLKVTLEVVERALKGCPALQQLDINHCPAVRAEAVAERLRVICPAMTTVRYGSRPIRVVVSNA